MEIQSALFVSSRCIKMASTVTPVHTQKVLCICNIVFFKFSCCFGEFNLLDQVF